jgi:hypothetical protein
MPPTDAAAYLFANGNAVFLDHDGEQIFRLQRLGLSGLHGFVAEFPGAPVYWGIWRGAAQQVDAETLPWLLRHIRVRPGPRPKYKEVDDAR